MDIVRSVLRFVWRRCVAITASLILLGFTATLALTYYTLNLPQLASDQQQTIVLGPTRFAPQSQSALRVLVREQSSGQPIANAHVSVQLAPKGGGAAQTLYSGQTDARGGAPVSFTLPESAAREQTLIVETSSPLGRDHIEKPVLVQRTYKVLVTSDKPLYQPSQTMHIRALALGALDRAPAQNESVEFLIEDPKGNKVLCKSVPASTFGVSSVDFTLADTVISGEYKISATVGDSKSEKTVTVKPYVVPRFRVAVETERTYYVPGESVVGRVRADYFFGKPVVKSSVTLVGSGFDVQRVEMVKLQGQTDENGMYMFAFELPNYFAGRGLDKNRADFALEVAVNDQANHTEQSAIVLPIARDPILIDAVAESGRLVVGVENVVYILTTTPDGAPLETDVTVGADGRPLLQVLQARTGKYGLAEIRITPSSFFGTTALDISARDAKGRAARHSISLPNETTRNQILLRADRAAYRVGETMKLEMLTSGSVGTVYLDIIKAGQTLSTRAVDTQNGRATASVDVTNTLVGTIQLHAYHVELDGTIVRDTRLTVVEPSDELRIAVTADQETYRPGAAARLTFSVTNRSGKGVPSALGIAAVDESVFALAAQDPGFAKLYFLLQKELLEPKYQVKGFALPEVLSDQAPEVLRGPQDQAARAAWANAPAATLALHVDSRVEKHMAIMQQQAAILAPLSDGLAHLLVLIALALMGLTGASLRARGALGRSGLRWFLVALVTAFLFYCLVSIADVDLLLLGRLMLLGLVVGWLLCIGVLVAYARRAQDRWVQVALWLLVAYLAFMILLGFLLSQTRVTALPNGSAIAFASLVGAAALILLGAGLLQRGETAAGWAAVWLPLVPALGVLLVLVWDWDGAMYRSRSYLGRAMPMPRGSGMEFAALMPAPDAPPPVPQPASGAAPSQEAPRLRQYFPETLYVNPQLIADDSGQATLTVPLADSITTWRLSVTASSQRGELGAARAGLRVFQDFFVDLDLPVALTQNDEIAVPIAVYNYLPQAQQVRLQIDQQSWFALQDQPEKTLTIASNDIEVVYFRIQALQFGAHHLKVTAWGDKMSDATQRSIRVHPDGKPIEVTRSNWLKGDTQESILMPSRAIAGASRLEVKIYPGIMSQVVEGLDNVFRMPFG